MTKGQKYKNLKTKKKEYYRFEPKIWPNFFILVNFNVLIEKVKKMSSFYLKFLIGLFSRSLSTYFGPLVFIYSVVRFWFNVLDS